MSRIGKLPITVPSQVKVELKDREVLVKGPKGELKTAITGDVSVQLDDGKLVVAPANDSIRARTMWGTTRANLNNMIRGVSEGFVIDLDINGVGYRAAADKKILTIALGYSHEIKFAIPAGISIVCEKPTSIQVSGHDKQKVGQVAALICGLRRQDPYKQKGIFRRGQRIRSKEGKKK